MNRKVEKNPEQIKFIEQKKVGCKTVSPNSSVNRKTYINQELLFNTYQMSKILKFLTKLTLHFGE